MLSKSLIKPHDYLMKSIFKDRNKLEWYLWTDPAAASCFAVLFWAINPYSKKIYVLDEIYEKRQGQMSVSQICPRIFRQRDALYDDDVDRWRMGYDEAETWFASEALDHFGAHFEPSQKAKHDKEDGLTLIKDIMLKNKLEISDRCLKFFWELDNYVKDKHGKIPKVDDHLIDCFRYGLGAAYYSLSETEEYLESQDENFRGARISDDFPDLDDLSFQRDTFDTIL